MAYLDAAKEQNPTIGIGFNLRAYMDVVARAFGIDPNDTNRKDNRGQTELTRVLL